MISFNYESNYPEWHNENIRTTVSEEVTGVELLAAFLNFMRKIGYADSVIENALADASGPDIEEWIANTMIGLY